MTDPTPRRRAIALLVAQSVLALGLYLLSVRGFLWAADHHGDDFAGLARRDFLTTIVVYQLRVLPAYAVLVLAATALTWPLLHRTRTLADAAARRGRWPRLRLLSLTLGVDMVVGLASLGPFYHRNPGLLDGTARKLAAASSSVDLYVLYRWHLLDVGRAVFGLLLAYAVFHYLRALWRRLGPRLAAAAGAAGMVALGVGWSVGGAPPTPAPDAPLSVLIIASDSLRYDHLGVHGYHRQDISPNIDAFAREAVDFTQLHVATASTLESWLSTFSSQFPPDHGVRYMYLRREQAEAAGRIPNLLPRVLDALGYVSIVVSNWAGNCFKLVDVGFERNLASDTQNFESFLMETTIWSHLVFPLYFSNALGEWMLPEAARTTKYVRPSALDEKMLAEIDDATRAGKPFFGLLFYSTTHLPYTARYPFNLKYVDPDYRGAHRYQIDVRVHELISTGFDPDLPPETIQQIRDLYDGTVSEFDFHVGKVLDELKRRGLYDKTIVIVTSDHGEDLYDPGSTLGHGTNFFGGDQSTRIPFFIRVPGVTEPGVFDALTRNIDLAPTLLGLLGHSAPETWTGVDLAPALTGHAPPPDDLPVFAETCYLFFPKRKAMIVLSPEERARVLDSSSARDTLEVDHDFDNNMVLRADLHDQVLATKDRMVRTRRWKLLHIPGEGEPIHRLYDMIEDPHQTTDLSGAGLPVLPRLKAMLDAYWRGEGAEQRWDPRWDERIKAPDPGISTRLAPPVTGPLR